jgi:hypothetical protein
MERKILGAGVAEVENFGKRRRSSALRLSKHQQSNKHQTNIKQTTRAVQI